MNVITHFLMGWTTAQVGPLDRRERAIVTWASVIPDLDGLGIVPELLTRESENPLLWWTDYHHVIAHNLGGAFVITAAAFALSKRRALTAALACISFHLHLLGDLVGSRGPEGEQWSIPYLLPFSDSVQAVWEGQWPLNAWPNFVITAVLLAATFWFAWRRGYSPLEMFSSSADQAFVGTLRTRFPR